MPDLSGRLLGDYELLSPIGHGGMAAVYQARHRPTERIVAVKVLSPQVAENESFLLRFRREARVVKRLHHPNIVPVEGFGEVGEYAFLVMPYLRTGSLADRLAHGPLTPQEGGRIMSQICSALDYAHREGVVHRDVKPSNILLDEDGNSVLADFGLAQIHDASISLTGSALLGTPAYIPPEQVRGEPVDARSDQYSLGIVLYQLTTNHLPFEAETPMAVLLKHVNDPMPRPRLVNPRIPETVERVILKATAKDPAERFESMAAMNAAFQAALAHAFDPRRNPAPTIPLPASATMILRPPVRSRRLSPWLLAAVALLLLACPLAATYVGGRGQPTPTPADRSAPQLTVMAATIDALSTEIVAARLGPMSAGEVGTAAAGTASAAPTQDTSLTGTVSATPSTGGTATAFPGTTTASGVSSTAGASPTRSITPSPAGTGTQSASSTPTRTPTGLVPTIPSTQIPTMTLPLPTGTSLPSPTTTQAPLACDSSELTGFGIDGMTAAVGLRNGGPAFVRITGILLDWPPLNGHLVEIRLRGNSIWSEGDTVPPTSVDSNWSGGPAARVVLPGDTDPLGFVFLFPPRPSGYNLSVELNNECSLTVGV